MRVPRKFRRRWKLMAVRIYGTAVLRWIGYGFRNMRPLWRDARHRILSVKLSDARSPGMRSVLGDDQAEVLYNTLLRAFIENGQSRRMVEGEPR